MPQKSKNAKIIARFRRCKKFWIFGFLDFWIFLFWDFGIFGFLDFRIFGFLDFRSRCLIAVMDKLAKCAFVRVGGGG